MMAIITINTIPISDFLGRWVSAIGVDGFYIILICIFLYQFASFIQLTKNDSNREIKNKLWKVYFKKQDEINKINNPEQFREESNKLLKWKIKMERKYGRFTYY